VFVKTVSTKQVNITGRYLSNHNKLLWSLEGAEGVKTGYTRAAGRILVSSVYRSDRRLVTVTINAPRDWQDHRDLVTAGFMHYKPQHVIYEGETVGYVEVIGADHDQVALIAEADCVCTLADWEIPKIVIREFGVAYAPVVYGQFAGCAYVKVDDAVIGRVNLYYGDFHALKGINMNITENEISAFIGPSGCGKSTFLKSLNRMNDLVEGCKITGKALLDGEDIYGDMDVNLLRRRVGMVFQKPNPFPMSVYDNIAFGPRTHGIRSKVLLDEIVEKSLRDAAIWDELKDRLKKSALGLSGGQQQRLCIARALAVQPEVLLMDEPTSALDPISTSKIEDLVLELKKEYTIVMVTHNMQQAARISDKTAFFLLGEVIEYDNTEKLFSTPRDKRTEDYITGRFG